MSQDWRNLFGTIDVSTSGVRGTATNVVTPPPAAPAKAAAAQPAPQPVSQPQPQNTQSYPSAWTMAQTFTTSAVQFAASGGQTVSREVREERLSICKMCPQFDGTRCIQCGCFIAAKTWVPHEKCPAGKWPT